MDAKILQSFPNLDLSAPKLREAFLKQALRETFPAGQVLAMESDESNYFSLVLSGRARIYKVGHSGREFTLYTVNPGESCILTAFSILSHTRFPAIAVVEEELETLLIPAEIFREWVDKYDVWRIYVFNLLSQRLNEILSLMEEIAFHRIDARIANYLLRLSDNSGKYLLTTHQKISQDVGTAREVVSRVLKEFEREHLITLKRGKILLDDLRGLQKRAGNSDLM